MVQTFRPVKKGLQTDQSLLFSARGGTTSILVVETRCSVLLVEKGNARVILKSGTKMMVPDSYSANAPLSCSPSPLSTPISSSWTHSGIRHSQKNISTAKGHSDPAFQTLR